MASAHKEPVAELDARYGEPDVTATPWMEGRRLLEQAELFWLTTVRGDGRPRESRPLNAYERRIIHVAISEEPGLRTFSVGEGADRRVTVAPADPEAEG